ncbi:MAG: hypothetical protein OQK25_04690 [Gammaproteobacteria bacterium]|nr:hypothetical protein [Gammaproteobacteria bacterium]
MLPLSAWASEWNITLFTGAVFNSKEDLLLKQNSNPDIFIPNAQLKTKPLTPPPYYGLRLAREIEGGAWEIEHIHQKLYLDDLPANLQRFEVTDGYNLFYVNRSWTQPEGVEYRVGVGAVIAHPDITIYNQSNHVSGGGAIPKIWADGYHWCGVSLQAGYSRSFKRSDRWAIVPEVKLTHSMANIPIYDGSVRLNNTALHLNIGVNYKL